MLVLIVMGAYILSGIIALVGGFLIWNEDYEKRKR